MKIPIKEKRASALADQVSLFRSSKPRRHFYLEMTPGLLFLNYNRSESKPQQVCAHFKTGWLFHFPALSFQLWAFSYELQNDQDLPRYHLFGT